MDAIGKATSRALTRGVMSVLIEETRQRIMHACIRPLCLLDLLIHQPSSSFAATMIN